MWWIFSSNNSAPANRKTGFYATCDSNRQEVGFNFAWSGSELWSCFRYSVLKLKNQKHIAVDVLLKGFPMVPLSCRSNLARRYLLMPFSLCSIYVPSMENSDIFCIFKVLNSTLMHLPPHRFHSVGSYWDRIQDCCDCGIGQTDALAARLDFIHREQIEKILYFGSVSLMWRSFSVQEGRVVGFFDAFQAGRKFALDMAGTVYSYTYKNIK